jgi:hypothetical protein
MHLWQDHQLTATTNCWSQTMWRKCKGYGIFSKVDSIPKGTRVALFSGKPVSIVDYDGREICSKPTVDYVIQVDRGGNKFLHCSESPKFGDHGYKKFTGQFVNSSHPHLPFPHNAPNSELVVGQNEEFLVDYHHLLVKLRIARSCGCYESVGALQSPEWIPGLGIQLGVPLWIKYAPVCADV